MDKVFFIVSVCALLLLVGCSDSGDSRDKKGPDCGRDADEASRVLTAKALLTMNAGNYQSLISYWAEDVIYKEPVLTNTGREEMLDYLAAIFSGTGYGFPNDRQVEIRNELYSTDQDGGMTYMATLQWTGTFGTEFFIQTGMSIIKFRPDEGCPYYHRDYYSEGDSWWNVPAWQPNISIFRNVYIEQFGLTERCFDDDGDEYAKYENSIGCPNQGLDCNDFVPGINPGVIEWPGNGVDEDCDPLTPTGSADPELKIYQ
jgi:hypothetical protein